MNPERHQRYLPFDGETYEPERDGVRLASQLFRVREALSNGRWWTLAELSEVAQGSEASVSARIRDLRKPKFGGREIEREYLSDGVWRYRMLPR